MNHGKLRTLVAAGTLSALAVACGGGSGSSGLASEGMPRTGLPG